MYYIMDAEGLKFAFYKGAWHSSETYMEGLRVLDYSDWSIETIAVNVLISAIETNKLSITDFVNLCKFSDGYRVTNGSFLDYGVAQFNASGMSFSLKDGLLVAELSNNRCFSLGCADGCLLVNYKKVVDLYFNGLGIIYARDLVPMSDAYVFEIGIPTMEVWLHREHFSIVCGLGTYVFPYISRAELARFSLLLVR